MTMTTATTTDVHPPATSAPPDRFDAAVLAALEAERQAADVARMAAEHRYAVASGAMARYLAAHGSRVIGGFRYVGLTSPGVPGGVVLRELAIPPPPGGPDPGAVAAADAAVAIDQDLLGGDTD
jgi:hypothetical protein